MAFSVEIAAAASTATLQAKYSALDHPLCTSATVRELFKSGVAVLLPSDTTAAIFCGAANRGQRLFHWEAN